MSTPRLVGAALVIAAGLTAAPAEAQGPSLGVTIGAKVTTLGYGPEVGLALGNRLGVRAGANFLSLGRDFDFSDIDYAVGLKYQNFTAMVDLYLLGPIRLSGGMAVNNNKLELEADPTVEVEFGNTTYQASDIGSISATIDYSRKTAPYLGLGIGGRGRIGFILEAGILFTGSPRLSYTATTTLTGPAATAFNNEVANETAQVQTDINDTAVLKTYPVVGFGLQIRI